MALLGAACSGSATVDETVEPGSLELIATASAGGVVAEEVPSLAFLGDLATFRSGPASVEVGPAGGSMALDGGARLDVPPGAFAAATALEIAVVDVSFDRYLPNAPHATMYVLSTATDAALPEPVVVEVPGPPDAVVVEALDAQGWHEVAVAAGPTTRIEIDQFSEQVRAVVPRSALGLVTETDWQRVREMEREDEQRRSDFLDGGWCWELAAILVSSDEYDEANRASIATLYLWAVCSDWPVDEACLSAIDGRGTNVRNRVRECVRPPAPGADRAAEQAEEDDAGTASEPESDAEPGATDPPDALAEDADAPAPPGREGESQAALGDSARTFAGTGLITYTVKSIENVLGVVEGCRVEMPVDTQVSLQLDGTVALSFADWPLSAGFTEGNPPTRQWVECFAPAAVESWGDGNTGPNPRIYSTSWIGVGDTIFWPPIAIGQIGEIRVDIDDTQATPVATGTARLAIDTELLTNTGSEIITDAQVYTIDFRLDEVSEPG